LSNPKDRKRLDALLKAAVEEDPNFYVELEKQNAQTYRDKVLQRRMGERIVPKNLPKRDRPTDVGGKTMLCIGDSHAHPEHSNHRYEWLGRMVVDLQPDIIWDVGDWWDMPSLFPSDVGKKSFEGKRYWRDIEAGLDAMDRFQKPIDEYNQGRRNKYEPRKIRTLGNHEFRIERVIELEPHFSGIISTDDLMSTLYGWEEYEFKTPVVVEGVALCHYFVSGIMERAIGGEHPATMLIKKQFHSCLQGHSHQLDYADRVDASGQVIQAFHIGCYFDYDMDWAGKQANRMYNRGLLVLRNVRRGQFDFEWVSIKRVQEKYA